MEIRKISRKEQLEYLMWFLKNQIKEYESELKEVESEYMTLTMDKKK